MDTEGFVLFKGGYLVDGTGSKGFTGDLLIKGDTIEQVSRESIQIDCHTLDCAGKITAPGFIDMHSHMDWILPIPGREELKSPFTAQGCTMFIAGNCGFSPAGTLKDSPYKQLISLGGRIPFDITWSTMEEFFTYLGQTGLSHNMATLAGHGISRASICGMKPDPLDPTEMKQLLGLLEEAMDQGAIGVSFGLGYEPGIFANNDEIREVARLVARKGKLITVHGKAYSALSMAYEITADGPPHNVLSLREMIDIARETGVRLQYSHLMFAGSNSHPTYQQCLDVLDEARQQGVDVMTDTYPYHCGNSVINVFIPAWFLADLPRNYHDADALKRVEEEIEFVSQALGFGFDDIQISHAGHPELNQYNGLFLSEIAEKRGMTAFQVMMDFSEKTGGRATVLNYNYSNMEIIDALIKHPACLFMTDTVISPRGGVQNPATYGAFPLLLQYARDRNLLSVEEAVHKMTGASAERFKLDSRGILRKGFAADITIFDWNRVKDNCTVSQTDQAPDGIEAVFMNGRQVKADGKVDGSLTVGLVVS